MSKVLDKYSISYSTINLVSFTPYNEAMVMKFVARLPVPTLEQVNEFELVQSNLQNITEFANYSTVTSKSGLLVIETTSKIEYISH